MVRAVICDDCDDRYPSLFFSMKKDYMDNLMQPA